MNNLNPTRATIFRIVHVDSLPWVFDHGLHCQNSPEQDPSFVSIGLQNLIDKRRTRRVPIGQRGELGDYVAFYFTPCSIMLFNLLTGHNDVIKRSKKEIVFFVSSIHRLVDMGIPFLFTNGHAYMEETEYFDSVDDLKRIDWALLQSGDFKRDPDDPGKTSRYQAEALVYRHMPLDGLLGIACYDDNIKHRIERQATELNLNMRVESRPKWYF